jgi:DNA-directed RNA polymerase subunit RPC12/RpoP
MSIRRGQHRFRTPLDYRYRLYPLPTTADVRCPKCRSRRAFFLTPRELFAKDEQSGGYRVLPLPIEGTLSGAGACTTCGNSFSLIRWPEDAYFSADVRGGTVWAWNTTYLLALRARIAGNRVLERQLALSNGALPYFLSRIPKQAVVKHNRERLLRTIDDWLRRSTCASTRRR